MRSGRKWGMEEKRVAGNYGALTILQGLNYILPFLIIPFIVNKIELDRYGVVVTAQYFMAFCVAIVDFGFSTTATREAALLSSEGKDLSSLFNAVTYLKLFLLTAVFTVLMLVVASIPQYRTEFMVFILSYGYVVGHTLLSDWRFMGEERIKLLTTMQAVSKILYTALILIFISSPQDYLLVAGFNSLGALLVGVVMFIISTQGIKWQKPTFNFRNTLYKDSFQIAVSDMAGQLTYAANGIILSLFVPSQVMGVFNVFDKFILAAKKMFLPIYQALYPYLARKNDAQRKATMAKLIPSITVLGIVVTLGIFFVGPLVCDLLFTQVDFSEDYGKLQIMAIIALFTGLNLLYVNLYAPIYKLFKSRMNIMLIGSLVNVILAFIIVPYLGLLGTVCVAVFTEFVMMLCSYWYYIRHRQPGNPQVKG
ncbi:MAG: oligosaccharide flippase family protein [Nonlabens sp.]